MQGVANSFRFSENCCLNVDYRWFYIASRMHHSVVCSLFLLQIFVIKRVHRVSDVNEHANELTVSLVYL